MGAKQHSLSCSSLGRARNFGPCFMLAPSIFTADSCRFGLWDGFFSGGLTGDRGWGSSNCTTLAFTWVKLWLHPEAPADCEQTLWYSACTNDCHGWSGAGLNFPSAPNGLHTLFYHCFDQWKHNGASPFWRSLGGPMALSVPRQTIANCGSFSGQTSFNCWRMFGPFTVIFPTRGASLFIIRKIFSQISFWVIGFCLWVHFLLLEHGLFGGSLTLGFFSVARRGVSPL